MGNTFYELLLSPNIFLNKEKNTLVEMLSDKKMVSTLRNFKLGTTFGTHDRLTNNICMIYRLR